MSSMDPDPGDTPDLERGGGVAPGATPPETSQTSGLSAPEPDTSHHFPGTGIGAIATTAVLIALFAVVAVALVIWIF